MAKKQTKTATNPLLSRIGSKTATKSTAKTPKTSKANPLAAALNKGAIIKMTLSDRIQPVGQKTKPAADNGKSTAKVQKTTQKTKGVASVSFTKYVKKVEQHKQKAQQQKKNKQTTTNGSTAKVQLKKIASAQPQKTTVLSFKPKVDKKFLRIKNLEIGTSSTDLKRVLANMGQVAEIRVKDLPSGSTTAEIEFQSDKALQSAADKLNGAVADGRVIQVEVSSRREM